jgi:hypothetical protein
MATRTDMIATGRPAQRQHPTVERFLAVQANCLQAFGLNAAAQIPICGMPIDRDGKDREGHHRVWRRESGVQHGCSAPGGTGSGVFTVAHQRHPALIGFPCIQAVGRLV